MIPKPQKPGKLCGLPLTGAVNMMDVHFLIADLKVIFKALNLGCNLL